MAYVPQTWNNGSGGGTPLSASRMAYMETGIDDAHDIADAALAKAGGTMSGLLTLSGAPTNTLHAATKAYVDSNALLKTGGTMTGKITLDGDPTSTNHASNKGYVDSAVAGLSLPMVYLGRTNASGSSKTLSASLSSTYDHFLLYVHHSHTGSGIDNAWLRLNSDAAANYNQMRIVGSGEGTVAATLGDTSVGAFFYTGGSISGGKFEILSRSQNVVHVLGKTRSRATTNSHNRLVEQEVDWSQGPATSVQLVVDANNWTSFTYFDLYGIKT